MNVSRRSFISRSSLALLVAGAASVLPGLSAVFKSTAPAATAASVPMTGEPLVAHVRNVTSGEIALMVGTQKVVVRDVNLASSLYQAARARLGGK
jgi:hypothetical protein